MIRKINIDPGISDDVVLWRYLSLDKFIDLVNTRKLFLSPLSFFKDSDPMEGYLPKKFHAHNKDVIGSLQEELARAREELLSSEGRSADFKMRMSAHFEKQDKEWKDKGEKIHGSPCICCWHESLYESDAMWRLYGDNGKSIAIKTTVGKIRKSIESMSNKESVRLSRVKYLDYNDDNLDERDMFCEGSFSALIFKRIEFEHEKEVRLYYLPNKSDTALTEDELDNNFWEEYTITPHYVCVDIKQLIAEIVISPYVTEPYISSVKAVCSKFDLDEQIVSQSKLLQKFS